MYRSEEQIKQDMLNNVKNTVIEILASKKTKSKYRDTRFYRFRIDKNPEDCIW